MSISTIRNPICILAALVVIAAGCNKPNTQQLPPPPNNPVNPAAPPSDQPPTTERACPQDAKVCPDGSAVGRTGPNCTFAECPATSRLNEHGVYWNQTTVNGTATIDANIADNPAALEQALVHMGASKFVLFFHAPWCPFCKVADKAFLSRTNEIPAGVAIIKIDYDTHPNLKKLYGVTYQHTFVQVDVSGKQITKWNGGDIDNLKKYLK
jgi:thiol-disulfide isomerase/thioredoxin